MTGCDHGNCHFCRPPAAPAAPVKPPTRRAGTSDAPRPRAATRFAYAPTQLAPSPWAHELTAATESLEGTR